VIGAPVSLGEIPPCQAPESPRRSPPPNQAGASGQGPCQNVPGLVDLYVRPNSRAHRRPPRRRLPRLQHVLKARRAPGTGRAYQQRAHNPPTPATRADRRGVAALYKESSHRCNRTAIHTSTRGPPTAPTGPQTSAKCWFSTPGRQIYTGTFPGTTRHHQIQKNPQNAGLLDQRTKANQSVERRTEAKNRGRRDSNSGPHRSESRG
jgi:hypothetical protein